VNFAEDGYPPKSERVSGGFFGAIIALTGAFSTGVFATVQPSIAR
jgi:hypothetical protein